MNYFVYILECSDKTLYTGYTVDLSKRILLHNSKLGAKYTRGRTPVTLKYFEKFNNKSDALRREIEIKKLSKTQKLNLIKKG
ncbi:GIY-YIG nuclease family protein [Peptoniphilus mikwangii]|uniref:GIY-YIG nuclease family protein n=1 Tax=Peptoniphilus mikwangii TaxID=1354300 RepID=UPI0003FE11AB|nr:GIY-YIG nuclease family protein [Peptoniphilus mikwangii]